MCCIRKLKIDHEMFFCQQGGLFLRKNQYYFDLYEKKSDFLIVCLIEIPDSNS